MIRVKQIAKDFLEAGAMNSLIGLFGFIGNNVFLTKGGDLGIVIRVAGVDAECLDHAERDPEDQEPCPKSYAHHFSVCGAVGADRQNPIKLVRVKGRTKRLKTPRVLAPEQFHSLLPLIQEPYRTMVLIAGCLGLRVSEIVALQWGISIFLDSPC